MGKTKTEDGDDKKSAVRGRVCSLPSLRSYNALRWPERRWYLQNEVWCYLKLSVLSEKSVDSWTGNMCLRPTLV